MAPLQPPWKSTLSAPWMPRIYIRAPLAHKRSTLGLLGAMDLQKRFRRIAEISSSFTPGSPVNTVDLFAGRRDQIQFPDDA